MVLLPPHPPHTRYRSHTTSDSLHRLDDDIPLTPPSLLPPHTFAAVLPRYHRHSDTHRHAQDLWTECLGEDTTAGRTRVQS